MATHQQEAQVSTPDSTPRAVRVAWAWVVGGLVVVVVAYCSLLVAYDMGSVCPAVHPPPPGCEDDRGATGTLALVFPVAAAAGALVAVLGLPRWTRGARLALLVALLAVCTAGVVGVAALRGSIG